MPYITVLIVSAIAAVTSPVVFFNDWILRHDVPVLLRTIVYLVNPPDKLRSSIVVGEVVRGDGDVSYVNEYYGKYAIYLAKDASGHVYVKLDSGIKYSISCNDGGVHGASGIAMALPEMIWFYRIPVDLPVGGRVKCAVRVDTQKGDKLYIIVNKLFDV